MWLAGARKGVHLRDEQNNSNDNEQEKKVRKTFFFPLAEQRDVY